MLAQDRWRVVFMGTPEFALPSLELLIENEDVVAVVTQPDRPKGRGRVLSPPPIKLLALKYNIPVLQPETLKDDDTVRLIGGYSPDVIIVVSYGKILPQKILDMTAYGCINLHASLLPKYRGAAPIQWAIIKGEKETGVTTMKMDEGMDTGDILLQRKTPIKEEDDAKTIHDRLSSMGAELLIDTLRLVKRGELTPIPQDHSRATYAPRLKKEDGLIHWDMDALSIHNLIRGMNPWPGAYTTWHGKNLKVLRSRACEGETKDSETTPGIVLDASRDGLVVATGRGVLRITELQLEGGRAMRVEEFLRGHPIEHGDRLGG